MWMMKSAAWQAIGPFERTVLLELYGLYNGRNNGDVFLSCREAARRCNMSKNRANAALNRLREIGFIRYRSEDLGPFTERNAQCWILTEFGFAGHEPTKDFMDWKPSKKQIERRKSETPRLKSETDSGVDESKSQEASQIRDGEGHFARSAGLKSGTQLSSHMGALNGGALN